MNKETALQHVDFILKRNVDNPQDSVDDLVRLIDDILNPDNYYCAKCGSCGEPPCCDFHMCDKLKCAYGDSYIKSYNELSKEIDRLTNLSEGLDWKDDLPFDCCGNTYVWTELAETSVGPLMVLGGLCFVFDVDDPEADFWRKYIAVKPNKCFYYEIGDVKFCMYFYGEKPLFIDGSPQISKIARIQLGTLS